MPGCDHLSAVPTLTMAEPVNRLFYGDNLDVLRQHVATESVDLIYLDPPFNSNRSYNVIFARHDTVESADQAQIQAFDDTWHWSPVTDQQYTQAVSGGVPSRVADALTAFRMLLGENDAMAYLVNMTTRLVEMRRVLKADGSLYLHCDPTMSHYLKVLLDAIFGPEVFRNEIIWRYKTFHGNTKTYWAKKHDTLLFYTKSGQWHFKQVFGHDNEDTIDFKRWNAYLVGGDKILGGNMPMQDTRFTRYYRRWVRENKREPGPDDVVLEVKGQAIDSVWDIKAVDPKDKDKLGYPTQKPLALMTRIIEASSDVGDVVLDPFCGCGTTIDAAVRAERNWIGIDVTYIAIDLIEKRLRHTYGDDVTGTFDVLGIPKDAQSAQALFRHSPFDFERWAVSLVNAQPNQKQVGDKGIDGVARFPTDHKGGVGRVLVSVKGGKTVGPTFARDLVGTVQTQQAEMGVLIIMAEPTKGVLDAVNHAGTYTLPVNGQTFPKVQVITVAQLLRGELPQMPATFLPYIQATKAKAISQQATFDL